MKDIQELIDKYEKYIIESERYNQNQPVQPYKGEDLTDKKQFLSELKQLSPDKEVKKELCPFCDSSDIEIFQYSCKNCSCDFLVPKITTEQKKPHDLQTEEKKEICEHCGEDFTFLEPTKCCTDGCPNAIF